MTTLAEGTWRLRDSAVLVALAVVGMLAAVSLSGCSGGASGRGGHGTTVEITVKDGTVTPNGTRVEASVGEPVTLHIDADRAGELHVHSTPEQEVEFTAGTSTETLTIDRPGIVDVEDHALDQVVVQLEVS